MVNVSEATMGMGVVTEEATASVTGNLFGDKEVIVGPETGPEAVVQDVNATHVVDEDEEMPDQTEFYEQLRRMPSAERLQRTKDYLKSKLEDASLTPEQRQGIQALMQQSDEFLSQFIDSQIESRFAEVSSQTALTAYVESTDVEKEAEELVQEGVITPDQAKVAAENTIRLLQDGKGPKRKEGVKAALLQMAVGTAFDKAMNFDIDIDGMFKFMVAAMTGK